MRVRIIMLNLGDPDSCLQVKDPVAFNVMRYHAAADPRGILNSRRFNFGSALCSLRSCRHAVFWRRYPVAVISHCTSHGKSAC
jgi:hypothetical protein